MSNSLRPHELHHARVPCPSATPRACSNSWPSGQWSLPTISSSVVPFSCLQSCPASGSFPMSWLFTSGGQSTGVSASASVVTVIDTKQLEIWEANYWCILKQHKNGTHTAPHPPDASVILQQWKGLPSWLSGKESHLPSRRGRFNPWVGKIPWRRKWQPIPVFSPGKSHRQSSLAGYSPWGHKRVEHD